MKKTFTLIELILVIALIAVIGAVVANNSFRAIEKAKIARAAKDMNSIRAAAMLYYGDTGTWPLIGKTGSIRGTGTGFLTNNDGSGNRVPGWNGPYLEKWPNNPWGDPESGYGNKYYWDADWSGDDNGDGIVGEAQVIMFNVPRKSARILDEKYDNGILVGSDVGFVYQNLVVTPNHSADPLTLNWIITQPTTR